MNQRRKRHFAFMAFGISLIISLTLLELGLRAVQSDRIRQLKFAQRFGLGEIRNIQQDDRLGWRTRPATQITGSRKDCLGAETSFTNSTDSEGFRYRTDATQPPDVLVIGDSMLQADGVDDSAIFPAILASETGLNIWAYGCKGYGTTQEALWLEERISQFKPRAVLLAFCPNDFINNSLEWEKVDRNNNNLRPRPYLFEGGRVEIKDPSPPEYKMGHRLAISRTVTELLHKCRAEKEPEGEALARRTAQLLEKSKEITTEALKRLKSTCEAHKASLLVFYTHEKPVPEPLETAYRAVVDSAVISDLKGASLPVAQACLEADAPVSFLDASDAHWNIKGHAMIARSLQAKLKPADR